MMFLIPPKWFSTRYPKAASNLKSNRRSLTTPFDLYETVRDLADPHRLASKEIERRAEELTSSSAMPRGISWFLIIPPNRTCLDAAIPARWCTCDGKKEVSINDMRVKSVAHEMVAQINRMLTNFKQCMQLFLDDILGAHVLSSNMSNGNGQSVVPKFIIVQVQTLPGLAVFEGTFQIHMNGKFNKTGQISRMNLNGNQSACVDNLKMKFYCFCDEFNVKRRP